MAPVVERELRITYGAFTVGGTSDYLLDAGDDGRDRIRIDRSFTQTVVEFHVLTADHATDAAFAAACAAIEEAFTRPRLRLLIEQGDLSGTPSTLLDLDPASDTGIDVAATCQKVAGPHDTGRSRRYFVRITSGNPANQTATIAGEAGLRDWRASVRFLPSRLGVLDVSGTYTKLGANTAEQQYLAQIDTRVAAITDALGGTWELTDEQRRPNLEGSLIEFARTYEEVRLRQSLSVALDDTNVVRQRLRVAIGRDAPGDTGGDVLRLVTVDVAYEAWIVKTVTDLPGWWNTNGLPWVAAHAQATAQASGMALVARQENLDSNLNLVQAQLRFLAASGSAVLSRDVVTEDFDRKGKRFVPVWTGDPLAAYVFQGPRELYRTVIVTQTVPGTVSPPSHGARKGGAQPGGGGALGVFGIGQGLSLDFGAMGIFGLGQELSLEFLGPGQSSSGGGAGGGGIGPAPGVTAFEVIETRDRYRNRTLGLPGYQLPVTDLIRTTVSRLVTGVSAPGGGSGGAGSGGGTRPRPAQPGGAP